MKHQLLCLSVCLLWLGADDGGVLAQNLPQSKAEVEAGIAEQQRAEEAASQKAVDNPALFETSVSNFRYQQKNEPVPLFVNPGDAQGILLPTNAVYAQSQAGTFGQPPAEWLAIGKSLFPPGDPASPYGVRLNWDSALAVFNLVDKGIAGQKDLVIGFGGNAGDLLKFNFFPTVTSSASTTVVSVSSVGNVRSIGATRAGSETGTTQAPFVGAGYVGLVTRRINDTSFLSVGNFLARTDVLTLERDGTFGGIRINNSSGA
ncbi:MAG: hypothetical protein H7Y22_16485, partial [Gemmatimonadaceae bacterium]|nr:hypothetical protein [Gloeobacterales cyanobacterium ES-bin-141]